MMTSQPNKNPGTKKSQDRSEYQRRYYLKHREKMLEYQRDYNRRFKKKVRVSDLGQIGFRPAVKATLNMCDIMRANPEKVVVMVNNIIRGDRMFVSI